MAGGSGAAGAAGKPRLSEAYADWETGTEPEALKSPCHECQVQSVILSFNINGAPTMD